MRESRGKRCVEAVCDTGSTREAWGSRELRHNIEACVPSRTTSPLLLSIASLIRRKALSPPALAYDAHSAAGRPARMTYGLVAVAMRGTRSTPGESARRASVNGLRPSASSVAAGRRTRIGMCSDNVETRQAASVLSRGAIHGAGLIGRTRQMIVVSCPSFTEVFHN